MLLTWKLMYHLFLVIKLKLSIQMSYECQQDSVNRYNIYVSHNTPDMFLLSKSQSRLLFTFWWHTRTRLITELYLLSTLVYMSGCLYKVESIFPSKVHEITVGFWKGLCCSVFSFLVYCRLLLVCLGFFFTFPFCYWFLFDLWTWLFIWQFSSCFNRIFITRIFISNLVYQLCSAL